MLKNIFSVRKSSKCIAILSANKQIMRMRGTDAQKFFLSDSKCNFKSKAQAHEMFLSNEMKFFAMQKTDFHVFELFCRKSHFRT